LVHNLPTQVTSFIGRDAQLTEVSRLVRDSRMVTLTGAGGAGKTRLALQVTDGLLDSAAALGVEAFETEYAEGRALGLALAAHQGMQGITARHAAPRRGAPATEAGATETGAAVSAEHAAMLTPRELAVLKLVAQ
jgi:ABC-type dipeptide/oligopeptide/nickel transport system ATPase component